MFTCSMKAIRSLLSSLFLFLIAVHIVYASDDDASRRVLTILNWSEYMDPELVEKFEKKYNVVFKEVYFESDDYRDNYMLETGGEGVDVTVVNGIQLRLYRRENWIAPLTENNVPNLKHIENKWLTMFEGADGYAVPHFWGTTGIAYRKDLVKSKVTGWSDLVRPEEELRGKIAMPSSSRELFAMALKSLGYSINSTSFSELEEAKKLLMQLKPHVREYAYISLDENSSMVKGEVLMTMLYSGDALMLMEVDDNIEYVVPEEGSEFWVDYMVVNKASKNKGLAYQFINFINEPAHAAQLASYVYYASPNMAAEKLLPEEFTSDSTIYPSQEVLNKTETYARLPPKVTRFINEAFSQIVE